MRHWIFDIRCSIFDIRYSILDSRYSILDIGYSILDTHISKWGISSPKKRMVSVAETSPMPRGSSCGIASPCSSWPRKSRHREKGPNYRVSNKPIIRWDRYIHIWIIDYLILLVCNIWIVDDLISYIIIQQSSIYNPEGLKQDEIIEVMWIIDDQTHGWIVSNSSQVWWFSNDSDNDWRMIGEFRLTPKKKPFRSSKMPQLHLAAKMELPPKSSIFFGCFHDSNIFKPS